MIKNFLSLERQVGFLISSFFLALFISLPFFSNGSYNHFFLFSSISFFLIAILRSQWLQTLSILWMKLGSLISRILNPILIFLIYIISILPTALLLKLFFVELLDKKFDSNVVSYWKSKEYDDQDMTKQF
mgnify:CR=1 FL=1